MKTIQTVSVIFLLLTSELFAQGWGVRVTLLPSYQSWDLKFDAAQTGDATQPDIGFSQFSVPLAVHVPVGRSLGLDIRSSQASANSDQLASINGIADTQLALSYFWQNANLIFNINVNLPTGKTELSPDEFETSALIGHNAFGLRIPSFGQGANVLGSVTWVYAVSEKFVLGVGASYQLRGGFRPRADVPEEFNSGDEILLTAGFDTRLGNTTNFSTDFTLTQFGTDKLGDAEIFASGRRIVISSQLRQHFGFDELRLFARFRTKAKNEQALILGQPLVEELDNSFGNQLEILAHYRHRFSQRFNGKVLFDGRFYQEAAAFQDFETTPTFAGVSVIGLGIGPELSISRRVTVPVILKYFTGSFQNGPDVTGFEAEVGLQLSY